MSCNHKVGAPRQCKRGTQFASANKQQGFIWNRIQPSHGLRCTLFNGRLSGPCSRASNGSMRRWEKRYHRALWPYDLICSYPRSKEAPAWWTAALVMAPYVENLVATHSINVWDTKMAQIRTNATHCVVIARFVATLIHDFTNWVWRGSDVQLHGWPAIEVQFVWWTLRETEQ